MKTQIMKNSFAEGRAHSRLQQFSPEWIKKIRGSADFLGLNYYTSRLAKTLPQTKPLSRPTFEHDLRQNHDTKPEWKRAKSTWLYSVPSGIGDLLRFANSPLLRLEFVEISFSFFRWLKMEYNNLEVIITESGWSDDGQLDDVDRIEYYRSHLEEVLTVVLNGECNVKAYTGNNISSTQLIKEMNE